MMRSRSIALRFSFAGGLVSSQSVCVWTAVTPLYVHVFYTTSPGPSCQSPWSVKTVCLKHTSDLIPASVSVFCTQKGLAKWATPARPTKNNQSGTQTAPNPVMMWSKGSSDLMLVGVQSYTGIFQDNWNVCYKIKPSLRVWVSDCCLFIYPWELEMCVSKTPDHDACYNLICDCQIWPMIKMSFSITMDRKNFGSSRKWNIIHW